MSVQREKMWLSYTSDLPVCRPNCGIGHLQTGDREIGLYFFTCERYMSYTRPSFLPCDFLGGIIRWNVSSVVQIQHKATDTL